ncbi:glycosyltransferase [Devosia sp. PTR5]|uniref:Glycosyltransferase n=2 Tax=Devosia oryzisoli TaxID=2774138 RepID=A0A927IRK4_9HYPH|nr:glycosyltransferase [Devosia oryzisoli]
MPPSPPRVTIGIKALNEARHIQASIESALAAVEPYGGDVVLADSGSTDGTIEIARRYPVRIVQLADPAQRSCGAGAQMAFQASHDSDYFYLLDGDMVLDPAFLAAGLRYLEQNPRVAGVGGHVMEMNTAGEGFQIRARTVRTDPNWLPGIVNRLDCGGLYRTQAIEELGYFADRNLHAFEEFELGARLQSRGWQLARIDHPAVEHYGHQMGGYSLLWRRMKSGYAGAPGEVLRGALGQRHQSIVLRRMSHIRNGAAVLAWWLAILIVLFLPIPVGFRLALALALLLAPLLFLSWRRGGFRLGLYSLAAWNVSAWGLLSGFFRTRARPADPLQLRELQAGSDRSPTELRASQRERPAGPLAQ